MYVRRYPELWLWMHRRWRDRDLFGESESDAASNDQMFSQSEAGEQ
jgi:hypothetical protein